MFPPPPSDQEIYDGVDDTDTVTRYVFISFKSFVSLAMCYHFGFYYCQIWHNKCWVKYWDDQQVDIHQDGYMNLNKF